MSLVRRFPRPLVVAGALLLASVPATPAFADWSLNLGYQNPYVSTYGVNLLYWGQKLGFEIGLGWVDLQARSEKEDLKDEDKDGDIDADDEKKRDKELKASLALAGEADLRYFFSSGGVAPYLQGGFGLGIGASDSGAGAGLGGGFVGLGLMLGSKSFYGYAALNMGASRDAFLQAGLGFDI